MKSKHLYANQKILEHKDPVLCVNLKYFVASTSQFLHS